MRFPLLHRAVWRLTVASSSLTAICAPAGLQAAEPVALHWLEDASANEARSVSWGVPWPEGALSPDSVFRLSDEAGSEIPIQSWPMAYWPDGSLKWSGHAAVAPADASGELILAPGQAPNERGNLNVVERDGRITIDTGALKCVIPTKGANLVESMTIGGTVVAKDGQLVGILQQGPSTYPEDAPPRQRFQSKLDSVVVEQSGPVRGVVRIEGKHRVDDSSREWLPFTVRLYFYHGDSTVRLTHTIIFDGDQEKDFVRGLGIRFAVPMREESRNRHVRFVGDDGGLWAEPLQPGGGHEEQETGERFEGSELFAQNAVWDDFKLSQPNPDGYTIVKRTNPKSSWVFAGAGKRAAGFGFVGDLGGGFGISVKDFWQSYPSAIEARGASSAEAELIAWLWSPDGQEMDMRHYDVVAHGLLASYEDVQPGMSTAYGVARTSELTLHPTADVPSRANTVALGEVGKGRPLLVASPEYIHSTGVFGVWSVVDRSTPFKATIEDGLQSVLDFYEGQVDDQDWYGFWQYGDFMHSYSYPRHKWHYDWGGHAWHNTELGSPLWLWYSFLRTGKADVFHLAEAMTRNNSETCVYHIGDMTGLGSRHNVVKWGDGAKEARISQAAHWRPHYYLTTDERTGDIMRLMLKSDEAMARYDPMRIAAPQVPGEPRFDARIRIGPDWFALAGNWMTEWERTGDVKWRDRILAGVDSIVAMPYWLETGQFNGLNPDLPGGGIGPLKGGGAQMVGMDLDTGKLTAIPDPLTKESIPVSYNLATIQGGAEVMFELVPLLGREDFATAWLQYCRIGEAPAEVLTRDQKTGAEGQDGQYVLSGQSGPRLAAYAYSKTKNPAFAEIAIQRLLERNGWRVEPKVLAGPDTLNRVEEAANISTNAASQTGLTAIQILELCADQLPTAAPDL